MSCALRSWSFFALAAGLLHSRAGKFPAPGVQTPHVTVKLRHGCQLQTMAHSMSYDPPISEDYPRSTIRPSQRSIHCVESRTLHTQCPCAQNNKLVRNKNV